MVCGVQNIVVRILRPANRYSLSFPRRLRVVRISFLMSAGVLSGIPRVSWIGQGPFPRAMLQL